MAGLYPLSGIRFFLMSSVCLCLLGWASVLRNFHVPSIETGAPWNCGSPIPQLPAWKEESQSSKSPSVVLAPPHTRRLRVLMGIFTVDRVIHFAYRRQFRMLFNLFPQYNDTRVCSLHDFENAPTDEQRYQCQFIYTFVVGGLKRANARTELVDDSVDILTPNRQFILAQDLMKNDVTFLNIRENMNDGKSQTWFKYATMVMEKYDLDYVGKMDSDSLPYMDKFFHYAYNNLPPPPYNSGIIIGVPIDKLWWSKPKSSFLTDQAEDFFRETYGKVMHLYAAGQCYILSRDLAETVVLEAPKSSGYREGHEDHDISAMAFHAPFPISFHFLSLQQQFWRHPIKRYKRSFRKFRTHWHNENVRMKKVLALRQEHMMKLAAEQRKADLLELEDLPEQLAAPVQMAFDEKEEGEEEEEEEDEGAVVLEGEADALEGEKEEEVKGA